VSWVAGQALRAAGVDHRPNKAMRHTFATWAIESGQIELSYVARIMGTSVRELEDTYFRWDTDSDSSPAIGFLTVRFAIDSSAFGH
jgi:integrase